MSKEDIVFKELQHAPLFDLKAELLFEVLLRHKIQEKSIAVTPEGNFYRKFSKDVMQVEPDMNRTDMWHFKISRDGFYDILPEGITHNYRSRGQNEDPVEEYKKRKKEEKEARHFLIPSKTSFSVSDTRWRNTNPIFSATSMPTGWPM